MAKPMTFHRSRTVVSSRRLPAIGRTLAAASLALSITAAPVPAAAEGDGAISKFFVGIGAGICTLVYTPLKVAYALTALPMGGLVYMWSVGNTEMTGRVVRSGTLGNFVVTPEHLRGNQSLDFVGPAREGPDPALRSSASSEASRDW
jgi:hypothetical protein